LKHGAAKVFAVDSGTNQMIWRLRNDERIVLMENTNARHLTSDQITEEVDLVTIDVSFISARLVLEPVLKFLKRDGKIVLLVKPQFEVGKGEVGKGGIVKDPLKRNRVVDEIAAFAEKVGVEPVSRVALQQTASLVRIVGVAAASRVARTVRAEKKADGCNAGFAASL